jgi:hypothetical protein
MKKKSIKKSESIKKITNTSNVIENLFNKFYEEGVQAAEVVLKSGEGAVNPYKEYFSLKAKEWKKGYNDFMKKISG